MSDVAILELKLEMRELRCDIDALMRIHNYVPEDQLRIPTKHTHLHDSCGCEQSVREIRCSMCGTKAIEVLPCTCRVQR